MIFFVFSKCMKESFLYDVFSCFLIINEMIDEVVKMVVVVFYDFFVCVDIFGTDFG